MKPVRDRCRSCPRLSLVAHGDGEVVKAVCKGGDQCCQRLRRKTGRGIAEGHKLSVGLADGSNDALFDRFCRRRPGNDQLCGMPRSARKPKQVLTEGLAFGKRALPGDDDRQVRFGGVKGHEGFCKMWMSARCCPSQPRAAINRATPSIGEPSRRARRLLMPKLATRSVSKIWPDRLAKDRKSHATFGSIFDSGGLSQSPISHRRSRITKSSAPP